MFASLPSISYKWLPPWHLKERVPLHITSFNDFLQAGKKVTRRAVCTYQPRKLSLNVNESLN